MEIKDHILQGENIRKPVWTTKKSGKFEKGNLDTVIVHYTAGPYQPSLNTLVNPNVKASAHVIVDRDGSITQLVPFDEISWHAGQSAYGGRVGFNKYSIGIEIVNSGPLTKSGNVYRSWFGAAYNPSDVIEAIHRNQTRPKFWHIYTEDQIQAVSDLCRALIDAYGIKNILGHEEIAPRRKTDPGPAFPLDRLRNNLLLADRSDDAVEQTPEIGRIVSNKLNIRETPAETAEKVAKPLSQGTKVRILDEANGWYKVAVEVEGWVFGKYVETE
jgi:N-acetylmuramoyl-L-alanine amidase